MQIIEIYRNISDNSLYRFVIVGISNTLISYIVFLNLYYFLFINNASKSQFFSYSAGILWSFYWNRRWTFKSKANAVRKFLFFSLLQLSMLLLSVSLVHILIDQYKNNPTVSWIFVMAIVTSINYLCNKYIVFKKKSI